MMELNANDIKQARKSRGLTQKEFGDMIGVSQQAVGQYETGKARPSNNTIKRILELINIGTGPWFFQDNRESGVYDFVRISSVLGVGCEPYTYNGESGYAFRIKGENVKYFLTYKAVGYLQRMTADNILSMIRSASIAQIPYQDEES